MSDCSDQTHHDCDEALENLYLYLDSELDDANSAKIRSHLEVCQGCSKPFDFERRLRAVVRDRLDETVPDQLVDKVRQAIEAERLGSGN